MIENATWCMVGIGAGIALTIVAQEIIKFFIGGN